jgi:ankyrin repeat protein
MTMAINCLHRILKETDNLFSRVCKDVGDEEDCWTSISQQGSDFEKFHTVFNKLSLVAQATLESMVISNEPEDLHAALPTFRFQVLWNKMQKDECIHCVRSVVAQPILKELHRLEDPAAAFVMRLAIIHSYPSHQSPEITDRLHELHADVQSKFEALLRHLDLYDAMPSISQKHNLYYPEEISLHRPFTGDVVGDMVASYQLDCLGRNQLHHTIDKRIGMLACKRTCFVTEVQDTFTPQQDNFKPQQDKFNERDILGRTPLHAACHKMSLKTVETFLKFGADVSRMTVFGSRPLHYAAARGSIGICGALLATHEIDTDALDKHGRTALMYAIRKEHVNVVKLLVSENLENHADPNKYGTGCRPPLIDAILQGNEEIVRLLLDAGADPVTEFYGYNAFHFATSAENLQMMALLAEKIPAHLLDTKDACGFTPLMTAVECEFIEGVSLISGLTGVDVNARGKGRCTPLMVAAKTGQDEVVEELLKHNVYASAVDADGHTAADWARMYGYNSIVDLIKVYEEPSLSRKLTRV